MSVEGNSKDCTFCAIVRRDTPAIRVFESTEVLAFFPLDPALVGHTLVIPKTHSVNIWDIPEKDMLKVVSVSLLIAQAIKGSLSPDGLNLIQSSGAAASQTVPHIHVHLVPRWEGDRMGSIWPVSKPWKRGDLERAASRIRSGIPS